MLKLTQRAWNNVIIVSMLMLIFLFNFSGNLLNENAANSSDVLTLVPDGAVITTIEFTQAKVERIGQGWRIQSSTQSNQDLAEFVKHWQQAKISLVSNETEWDSSAHNVSLWFAGQTQPIKYQFMPLADKTFIKIDNQTYQLISPNYQMLTLSE